MVTLKQLALIIVTAPLLGSLIAGLFRKQVGRIGAHRITISLMAVCLVAALVLAKMVLIDGVAPINTPLYTWMSGVNFFQYTFSLGFLIDPLTAVMIMVVTSISFLVHIYTIGYMADDDGYQRFFSYISLFTFFMLMLVTANNFLQLFFGWEGVGLVSYLLIGFWFKRESAIQGNLKAFLVNRVGDFGFILGIALIFASTGTLDYQQVFNQIPQLSSQTIEIFSGFPWSLISAMCILLFIGAMGKSAQVPLHVWLPESMEGPTPISALIHAATMVTAGVFMVARMSPLFEHSETALSFVLIIGATGALFTGLLAIVMNDIKRVIAYSTLSQLGYMMVAMGVSAYSAGIFHLATHACFKAALFLGAGSVIMAMHHEHDMRKMGGLWRYMPLTYITFVIASLALAAVPPFAGFFSKDLIIDSTKESALTGASYAYFCVAAGAFVTAFYSFRALFLTFHGKPRMDHHTLEHVKESPWVICLPLILLVIPSIALGWLLIGPMIFAKPSLLAPSIFVLPAHDALQTVIAHLNTASDMLKESFFTLTFWLVMAGTVTAWLFYIAFPQLPDFFSKRFSGIYNLLVRKYGFDDFNDVVFVRGSKGLGNLLFNRGDRQLIDGMLVNGSALSMVWLSLKTRVLQSGYLYHYATVMFASVLLFLVWFFLK